MEIRPTKESDLHDVLLVEKAAFGTEEGQEIADLVNDLHWSSVKPTIHS